MILITGGVADPNIACLVSRASRMGIKFKIVYAGISKIAWNLDGELLVDGQSTGATALFQRHNVFGYDPSNGSHWNWYLNWYHTFRSYGLIRKLRMFDNESGFSTTRKIMDLAEAARIGFRIPKTIVTDSLIPPGENILKPVCGGDHTKILNSEKDFYCGAGFAQERLRGQEYRAYVVGNEVFAFRMETASLDYREKQDVKVVPVPLSDIRVAEKVRQMSHQRGLFFSATDLKEDDNGQIHFLEINSAPMYSEFDRAIDGQLCEAMLTWLGV